MLSDNLKSIDTQPKGVVERPPGASDFFDLLNATVVATLLLDINFHVRLFNPPMRELLSLGAGNIGHKLPDDLLNDFDPDLAADMLAVRATGALRERVVQSASGAWFSRVAAPYRTATGATTGVLLTFIDITRLKQAERISAAAQRYAEFIVDTAREPMAVISEGLRISSANAAFCAAFGLLPAQVGQDTLHDLGRRVLSHPPLLQLVERMLSGTDEASQLTVEVAEPDETCGIWSASLRRVATSPEDVPLVVLGMENITSQHQIIDDQMQLLIDSLPIACLAVDRAGCIRFVSKEMVALFGYAAAELVGQTGAMLLPPEYQDRYAALHEAYLADPHSWRSGLGVALSGITKNGTRLPLDIGLSPVDTARGRLIIIMLHDLRSIKQTESERDELRAALAEELEDMRRLHHLATRPAAAASLPANLGEILDIVIALQHADFGFVQLYDPAAGKLSLVSHRGFADAFLKKFAEPDIKAGTASGEAIRTGRRVVISNVLRDPGYAPYRAMAEAGGYLAVQATPIIARDGAVKGVLSTQFRRLYEPSERERHFTDLCLRMAAEQIERAQTGAALQAAREAADQANAAKTRFLSAAGHDLRQPLQTIGLLKSVLERQALNPPSFVTLAKLDGAIRYMQDLVEALLDASEIDSGSLPVELVDLQLAPFLTSLVNDFAPVAAAKGLILRCVPGHAVIRSDRRMLGRMLGNLLTNALKYSDKGKILLGCRRRGDKLRIELWDSGEGIGPENLNSIFGETTRNRPPGDDKPGLGLGLYIVKQFAERLGYEVMARSIKGRGSMFALIIPAPPLAQEAICGPAETEAREPWILLVEKDPAQRDALQSLLRLEAYQTLAVRNAAEALEQAVLLPPGAPHVIIADQDSTGGEAGGSLIGQLRRRLQRQVPAFILSGRALEADAARAAIADIQVIIKPVRPPRLLAAIEQAVSKSLPGWQPRPDVARQLVVSLPAPVIPESEIAIIDDDPGLCGAVRDVLEGAAFGVGIFPSAEAFLADSGRGRFRCLIVDINLPGMSGTELQAQLKLLPDGPQIIFLTGNMDLPLATQALRDGAADFLHKPVQGLALLQSVMTALRQERILRDRGTQHTDIEVRLARLTRREREIIQRVVRGELNKNIAIDLGISERTIEHHRQSVMRKMEAKSLAALVRMLT